MTARHLLVVAAALIDQADRVLVAQRPLEKAHGGLWEFPGGKVEPGETLIAALARELDEELGVAIDVAAALPIGFATRDVGDHELVLLLFAVDRWAGTAAAIEHQAIRWLPVEAVAALSMPPADRDLLRSLERWMSQR